MVTGGLEFAQEHQQTDQESWDSSYSLTDGHGISCFLKEASKGHKDDSQCHTKTDKDRQSQQLRGAEVSTSLEVPRAFWPGAG